METKKRLSEMNATSMDCIKGGSANGSTTTKTHYTSDKCGDEYKNIYDDNGRWVSMCCLVYYECKDTISSVN